MHSSDVMERRGRELNVLKAEEDMREMELLGEARRLASHGETTCIANRISALAVDDQGRLFKCFEEVDKPERSFGHVSSWDPDDPVRSAEHPDQLTLYLKTCGSVPEPKCRDCLWFPLHFGGCSRRRLNGENTCYSFRSEPEAFALAVYEAYRERTYKQAEEADPSC